MEVFSNHLLLWAVFFLPAYLLLKYRARLRLSKTVTVVVAIVALVAGGPFILGAIHLIVHGMLNLLLPLGH